MSERRWHGPGYRGGPIQSQPPLMPPLAGAGQEYCEDLTCDQAKGHPGQHTAFSPTEALRQSLDGAIGRVKVSGRMDAIDASHYAGHVETRLRERGFVVVPAATGGLRCNCSDSGTSGSCPFHDVSTAAPAPAGGAEPNDSGEGPAVPSLGDFSTRPLPRSAVDVALLADVLATVDVDPYKVAADYNRLIGSLPAASDGLPLASQEFRDAERDRLLNIPEHMRADGLPSVEALAAVLRAVGMPDPDAADYLEAASGQPMNYHAWAAAILAALRSGA